MSDQGEQKDVPTIVVNSSRFGELIVPIETLIEFPSGLVGFPRHQKFFIIEHTPPFSWLHSADDPNLAFVVVDGLEFGENYHLEPPIGDKEMELNESDEYAILVIVTVRPNARDTTANLKAPLFVNLRNRRGRQVIFDNPNLSTRFALWAEEPAPQEGGKEGGQGQKKSPDQK